MSVHRAALAAAVLSSLTLTVPSFGDVVTDWNLITVNATKTAGLNSNLGTRIDAIEAIATTPGEPPRTIASLSQGESENGLSRIYGGIHFAFDNYVGQTVGVEVGLYVLAHGPRPLEFADRQ